MVANLGLEWIGPIVLFIVAAISQNLEIMSITLGVISNYLTDWFRSAPKQGGKARLKMIEKTQEGSYKIFDYDGPAKNLGQIKDAMDRFYNERRN